jgi:hypothetical protein
MSLAKFMIFLTSFAPLMALAQSPLLGNLDTKSCEFIYRERGALVQGPGEVVRYQDLTLVHQGATDSLVWNPYLLSAIATLEKLVTQRGKKVGILDYDNNCLLVLEKDLHQWLIKFAFGTSGGRGGIGNTKGSGATTSGLHQTFLGVDEARRISQAPLNANLDPYNAGFLDPVVRPTLGFEDWKNDFVLTRFIRLKGLEDRNSSAVSRKILIHGTHEEGLLGFHESGGCIRMANRDVVVLYEELPLGSYFYVASSERKEKRRFVPSHLRRSFSAENHPDLKVKARR